MRGFFRPTENSRVPLAACALLLRSIHSRRPARHGEPLPTVTHVHLHGGPKVVHRYDLQTLADGAGVYTVRPRADRPAHDGSVAD